jgi:hypothetical protein
MPHPNPSPKEKGLKKGNRLIFCFKSSPLERIIHLLFVLTGVHEGYAV